MRFLFKSLIICTLLIGCTSKITAAKHRSSKADIPNWGCGLLGELPGIHADGSTSKQVQKMIDGIKDSSTFGMVSYWNWNLAPESNSDLSYQYLSKDFIFMPEQWGVAPVIDMYVRQAGVANFLDSNGHVCPATMGTIFLGANEPDITGSCMGDMMGRCTGSCTAGEVATGCPVAHLNDPTPANPLPNGHCDCWTDSHATGVGFWPVTNCSAQQPLPDLFKTGDCVKPVIDQWRQTAATVVAKGYKYLTTPLAAVSMDWVKSFIDAACTGCSDISCGCPTHIGWHFYANDCQPIALGGYADFQAKLDATVQIMEKYPFIQGAIVNEVGMLNCNMAGPDAQCIPNGSNQKYPAVNQTNHSCPVTDELPNGLGTFITELMNRVIKAKTADGRFAVAGFSWFNENMAGGTYNLELFNDDGSVNAVGDAYITACQMWRDARASTNNSTTQ